MVDQSAALLAMVEKRRIIMTIGAGGVGKTTSSAAIACLGALLGKKVALLSIDPAKRLADAMGNPTRQSAIAGAIPWAFRRQGFALRGDA